jgi:hypothetical protein
MIFGNHALRLRAETVARMEPFHEDRHFGVQARACPRGSICNQATKVLQEGENISSPLTFLIQKSISLA